MIGAEAFTRDRTGLRSITSMLEQARQDRTVAQLDRLCQRSAVETWLAASLRRSGRDGHLVGVGTDGVKITTGGAPMSSSSS